MTPILTLERGAGDAGTVTTSNLTVVGAATDAAVPAAPAAAPVPAAPADPPGAAAPVAAPATSGRRAGTPRGRTARPTGGAGSGAGARTARPELFVVATHKVRDRSGGAPNLWLPYGTEHAWQPGTRRTLCGEWITGWTVFWDRPFSARPAAACAACIEATLPEASRRRLDHFDDGRRAAGA